MLPVRNMDIDWSDLLSASFSRNTDASKDRENIESLWPSKHIAIGFSVRTLLDQYLTVLALPAGSEVIIPGLTIFHMVKIVKKHGLTPISIDIDLATMSFSLSALTKKVTDKTKLIIVTHLFGTYNRVEELGDFCKKKNIFLVEDCAQTFYYPGFVTDQYSDLILFSFGMAKRKSALGGSVGIVKNIQHYEALLERLSALPVQSSYEFNQRIFAAVILKILFYKPIYTFFFNLFKLFGHNIENTLAQGSVFKNQELFQAISKQPSNRLVKLLWRRLSRCNSSNSLNEHEHISIENSAVTLCGQAAHFKNFSSIVLVGGDSQRIINSLSKKLISGVNLDNLCLPAGSFSEYPSINKFILEKVYINNRCSFTKINQALRDT